MHFVWPLNAQDNPHDQAALRFDQKCRIAYPCLIMLAYRKLCLSPAQRRAAYKILFKTHIVDPTLMDIREV